jgi:hypothetical protein
MSTSTLSIRSRTEPRGPTWRSLIRGMRSVLRNSEKILNHETHHPGTLLGLIEVWTISDSIPISEVRVGKSHSVEPTQPVKPIPRSVNLVRLEHHLPAVPAVDHFNGLLDCLGPLAIGHPMRGGQKSQTVGGPEALDQFADLAEAFPGPGVILEDGLPLRAGALGKFDRHRRVVSPITVAGGFAGSKGFAGSSFDFGFDRSDRRPTLIRVTIDYLA